MHVTLRVCREYCMYVGISVGDWHVRTALIAYHSLCCHMTFMISVMRVTRTVKHTVFYLRWCNAGILISTMYTTSKVCISLNYSYSPSIYMYIRL